MAFEKWAKLQDARARERERGGLTMEVIPGFKVSKQSFIIRRSEN